ncbi:TonB-dependent receptor domain-containing protein [Ideonella sp.]|uniref:TonB-dependent receptor domain-containing protein n=1 Tax=Ideonella sp. TaxID=1929293 RepID=UPI002B4A68DE|nr:TonB-dependent receptor [Ideonella sp.]HJV67549.1 TonB-dependent receptor [Ideonella sp.]
MKYPCLALRRSAPPARASLLGLAAAAAFASPVASASAASAATPETLVVTAARIEQPVPDALPSTRVLTRDDIEAAQSADLAELLRQTTSVDIGQTGPLGSQTSVFLRGADSRQVLVLVDGVPFARADFGTASWQHLPLEQIERVEIVRGNLSALYGAQAVGGVVQIITRRGNGVSVDIGGGSQGTAFASASGGARFGEGATGTRLSGTLSHRQTEGYSAKNPATNPGANPDRDGGEQSALSAQLEQGWGEGQRTTVSLLLDRTRSDYDGFTAGQDDRLTSHVDSLGLQSRHALAAGWELGIDLGRNRERFDDPTGYAIDGEARNEAAGLQLQWQALAGHTLQLGVDSRRERFVDSNATDGNSRHTEGVRAGWLGHFGAADGGLDVEAALRHDDNNVYGSDTTGLVALGWRFAPGWTLTGKLGTSFSPPSLVDQQYAAPGVTLKAEKGRDAEVGLRWRGDGGWGGWFARATLFAQAQRDRIAFDPQTFEAGNIGHARNRGVELVGEGPIGPGVLGFEATFQDPRDEDSDTALLRRARESAALNYRVTLADWQLGAWLHHTGRRLDVDPSTFASVYNRPRTTLALTARYALARNWSLGFKLDNATDEDTPEVLGYTAAPRAFTVQLQGQWR